MTKLGGKKTPFNLGVRVKYRITEMLFFFCIFGNRDVYSVVENEQKKNHMIRPSCLLSLLKVS